MSDIPEEVPEDFSQFIADNEQTASRERVEANAKSVARSRRIRWSLRITILVCGAIVVAGFYFQPESSFLRGLFALSIVLILISAPILFMMGGLAFGSTRNLLSAKQKRMLDD